MNPYLKIILTSPNKYDVQFASSSLKFSLKSEVNLEAFQNEEEQLTANLNSTNRHRRIACTSLMMFISKANEKSIQKLLDNACSKQYDIYTLACNSLYQIAKSYQTDPKVENAIKVRIEFLTKEISSEGYSSNKERINRLKELIQKIIEKRASGWMDIEDIQYDLMLYGQEKKHWLHTIFIYGSRYHNTHNKESDIDIAIRFFESISEEEWKEYLPILEDDLIKIIPYDLDIQLFNSSTENPGVYEGLSKGCMAFIHSGGTMTNYHQNKEFKKL